MLANIFQEFMNFGDFEFDLYVSSKSKSPIVKETYETIWEAMHIQEMPPLTKDIWHEKQYNLKN